MNSEYIATIESIYVGFKSASKKNNIMSYQTYIDGGGNPTETEIKRGVPLFMNEDNFPLVSVMRATGNNRAVLIEAYKKMPLYIGDIIITAYANVALRFLIGGYCKINHLAAVRIAGERHMILVRDFTNLRAINTAIDRFLEIYLFRFSQAGKFREFVRQGDIFGPQSTIKG